MATMTAQQLTDFYFDLALDYGAVFTTTELNRCYTRADSDYDKALVYAVRVLLFDAAKLHSYQAASSGETLSTVFTNLKEMLKQFEERAGMGGATLAVGNIGLNIDADSDNQEQWDGSELSEL